MRSWTAPLVRRLRSSSGQRWRQYHVSAPSRQRQKLGVEDERGRDLKFRDPKTANRSHEDVDEVEDAANPTFIHEDGLSDDVDLRPEDVPFTKAFAILPNDVRTHRLRKHGNKPLPLSPVIDPVFVAARNRWKMTKALPPKPEEMTEFQRKLYANAYAHALATPVRESTFTSTHLPSHFLLPLSLQRSPTPPHAPTLTPTRLWASLPSYSSSDSSNPTIDRAGPQSYIDLTRGVLSILERQAARVRDSVASYGHAKGFSSNTRRELRIRPGIEGFVLELLRRGVTKSLAWLFKHPAAGLVKACDGGAYAAGEVEGEVAAVLYLIPSCGPEVEEIGQRVAREVIEGEIAGRRVRLWQVSVYGRLHPGETHTPKTSNPAPVQNPAAVYPATEWPIVRVSMPEGGSKVLPVYGLWELLGEEKVRELVKGTVFEGKRCVVLNGGDVRSLKAQMALLRLQGYLGQVVATRETMGGG